MYHGLRFAHAACVIGAALAAFASPNARAQEKSDKFWLFIGTYTDGASKGIYRCEFDAATGKPSAATLAATVKNPSFLAIHPSGQSLYTVNEVSDAANKNSGMVSAFALDAKTGKLTFLNRQTSSGAGPCYVTVDKAGKNVLVANYGAGTSSSIQLQSDGKIGDVASVVKDRGTGPDKGRQEGPHAHSINLDPANRFAVVCDLGIDQVLVFHFDPATGTLKPNTPPAANVAPGAGPRHFAFHPSGQFAYVINELNSTITAFNYDAKQGKLTTLQSISTLPKDYKGNTTTAEVVVHPSGKFVYGSNRGHDSIAAFSVDPDTGKLTFVSHQTENIKTPRNFAVDPTGNYVVVANQASDSLVVFRVNQKTGALESTGTVVPVPMPVCVRFVPIAK